MRIAQITDTHIMPAGINWLGDPETNVHRRLERVVVAINKLDPKPDLAILTGDNIDGCEYNLAYSELKRILAPLTIPYYLIPGNHDDRVALKQSFPNQEDTFFVVDSPSARIIGLDSQVPGQDFGELSAAQLQWLRATLNIRREVPVLIFVHHFPVKTGITVFDKMLLRNAEELESIIQFYPQVIGLVCGHLHNQFSSQFASRPLYISPSVAPNYFFDADNAKYPKLLNLEPPQFSLHQINGFGFWSKVVSVVRPERTLNWLAIR